MTTSHWIRTSGQKPASRADIVIAGGGYAGLATAFWLTEINPSLKICIVDRATLGEGASGRNAGFLTIGSAVFYKSLSEKWGLEKATDIHKFACHSVQLVQDILLRSFPEIEAVPSTSLTLCRNEEQLQSWKKDFLPDCFGFHWREENFFRGGLQGKFKGGLESPPEFKINPISLLQTLKKVLLSRNVTFIENNSAFEICQNGLKVETGILETDKVILAMNAYFPQFHSAFRHMITPRRAQMLAVELADNLEAPHLYYDPLDKVYWRKAKDNVLLIGGKRLLDETGETGEFEKVSPVIQNGLEEYLRQQLGLKFRIINRWSGTMGFTEHELPFIGKVQSPVESYVIGGFSGHGMGFGFHAGKDMAEVVTGLKTNSFFDQFRKAEVRL
ncbi:MAG: NAD(P)/FAD-dependent oxidoreductase [Bacteriovoracia bacterium]